MRFLARGVNAVVFCVEEKRERKKSSGKRRVLTGKTERYDNNYLQNGCFLSYFRYLTVHHSEKESIGNEGKTRKFRALGVDFVGACRLALFEWSTPHFVQHAQEFVLCFDEIPQLFFFLKIPRSFFIECKSYACYNDFGINHL